MAAYEKKKQLYDIESNEYEMNNKYETIIGDIVYNEKLNAPSVKIENEGQTNAQISHHIFNRQSFVFYQLSNSITRTLLKKHEKYLKKKYMKSFV